MRYSDTKFNVCVRLALSNTHLRMYGKGKKVTKVMIKENWVTGAYTFTFQKLLVVGLSYLQV